MSLTLIDDPVDHGFCDQCIRKWFRSGLRNASSCPECRIPAQEDQLSILFLETVVLDENSDSQTQGQTSLTQIVSQQASYVAKQLDKMGPESVASTVARAGKEIRNVTKEVKETSLSDDGVKVSFSESKSVRPFSCKLFYPGSCASC
jgi:hypothetical protein